MLEKLLEKLHEIELCVDPEKLTQSIQRSLELKQQLGELCVKEAISKTAKELSVGIFANPINKAAFARFIQPGTESKKTGINARTEREGILQGFIKGEYQGCSRKPLIESIGNIQAYAVVRNGDEIYTCTPLTKDLPIQVCCYPTGEYITSDIDLVAIAQTSEADTRSCSNDPFGELTYHDKYVIQILNENFRMIIKEKLGVNSYFTLIAHGPSNRFSGSKQSHLHFPMSLFLPDGRLVQFGDEQNRDESIQEFLEWRHDLQKIGNLITLNPLWNLNEYGKART